MVGGNLQPTRDQQHLNVIMFSYQAFYLLAHVLNAQVQLGYCDRYILLGRV